VDCQSQYQWNQDEDLKVVVSFILQLLLFRVALIQYLNEEVFTLLSFPDVSPMQGFCGANLSVYLGVFILVRLS